MRHVTWMMVSLLVAVFKCSVSEHQYTLLLQQAAELLEQAKAGREGLPDLSLGQAADTPADYEWRSTLLRKAIKHMQEVTTALPAVAKPWLGLGELYAHQHEWARARRSFKAGLTLDPSFAASAASTLGTAQRRAGLFEASIKTLRYAVSKASQVNDRSLSLAYYDLAVTYERQLVLQQKEAIRNSDTNIIEARKLQLLAINAYRRAIVHDDSNWKPFTSLGHLLTVVDNSNRTTLSEAQTLLQKANAVNPGQTVVINQLVTVLNWLHNKEAAAAVMQTAVQQGVYVQVWQYPAQMSNYNLAKLAVPWPDLLQPRYIRIKELVMSLEKAARHIRQEVLAFIDSKGGKMVPSMEALHNKHLGSWDMLKVDCSSDQTRLMLPHTCRQLRVRAVTVTGAFILRLAPRSHIKPHCGPSDDRLVVHMGLVVPACAKNVPPCVFLRCTSRSETWVEGKCLVFDDSFEHEVIHDGDTDRTILSLQVHKPEGMQRAVQHEL